MFKTENLGLGVSYRLLADRLLSSSYTFNSLGVPHQRQGWGGREGQTQNYTESLGLEKTFQIILSVMRGKTRRMSRAHAPGGCAPFAQSELSREGPTLHRYSAVLGQGGPQLAVPRLARSLGCRRLWHPWRGECDDLLPHSSLSPRWRVTNDSVPSTLQERRSEGWILPHLWGFSLLGRWGRCGPLMS